MRSVKENNQKRVNFESVKGRQLKGWQYLGLNLIKPPDAQGISKEWQNDKAWNVLHPPSEDCSPAIRRVREFQNNSNNNTTTTTPPPTKKKRSRSKIASSCELHSLFMQPWCLQNPQVRRNLSLICTITHKFKTCLIFAFRLHKISLPQHCNNADWLIFLDIFEVQKLLRYNTVAI